MAKQHSSHWFKRRRYGWGWTPVTWQGWSILGVYLLYVAWQVVLLTFETSTDRAIDLILFVVAVLMATATLIVVCVTKGPKPKWRWGKLPHDNKHDDF